MVSKCEKNSIIMLLLVLFFAHERCPSAKENGELIERIVRQESTCDSIAHYDRDEAPRCYNVILNLASALEDNEENNSRIVRITLKGGQAFQNSLQTSAAQALLKNVFVSDRLKKSLFSDKTFYPLYAKTLADAEKTQRIISHQWTISRIVSPLISAVSVAIIVYGGIGLRLDGMCEKTSVGPDGQTCIQVYDTHVIAGSLISLGVTLTVGSAAYLASSLTLRMTSRQL